MRYLNAISPVERFIASGSYRTPDQRVAQQWTIHELPDQAWLIRVDHVPQNILIQAWRSPVGQPAGQPTGKIERVDIRTLNPPPQRINYLLENGMIEYGHTRKDAQRIQQTLDLHQPQLVLPSVIGISLAIHENRLIGQPDATWVTLDLLALDLVTFQGKAQDWQKNVRQFNPVGIPKHYQDGSGIELTLTDFAAHPAFNLSIYPSQNETITNENNP